MFIVARKGRPWRRTVKLAGAPRARPRPRARAARAPGGARRARLGVQPTTRSSGGTWRSGRRWSEEGWGGGPRGARGPFLAAAGRL